MYRKPPRCQSGVSTSIHSWNRELSQTFLTSHSVIRASFLAGLPNTILVLLPCANFPISRALVFLIQS